MPRIAPPSPLRKRSSATSAAAAAAAARSAGRAALTAALGVEELDLLGVDLGGVLLHAFLVGVLARLDAAFDVDLPAFREVLPAELGELSPGLDPVPLG